MISSADIASATGEAVTEAAVTLRSDVHAALERALSNERSDRGRRVLDQLLENARIASGDRVPLCQDTGTVWVWIELGEQECLCGDLQVAVDAAVETAYRDARLRMSVARDALLDRTNTGTNTPAFVEVTFRPGSGATVHVMLKGGGSDNSSALAMLEPSDGMAGVERFVLDTVQAKATGACPPVIVGIGIGGSFDKVAGLAKKALLESLDSTPSDPAVVSLENRLLTVINATGIGPAGLGGDTTALAVKVKTAPCHIAALPVAVNMGCSAVRTASVEVRG
ncbi:MAG: fumarate hydratase [Actinomycetota bacterium]|nr:fumarate hydratase [Actinomycetota bacterium]